MNVGGERIAVGIVKKGEVEPAASEMLDQTAVGRHDADANVGSASADGGKRLEKQRHERIVVHHQMKYAVDVGRIEIFLADEILNHGAGAL